MFTTFFCEHKSWFCNHKWLFDHPNVGLTIKNNGNGFRIRHPGFDVTFVVLPSRMVVYHQEGGFTLNHVKPSIVVTLLSKIVML